MQSSLRIVGGLLREPAEVREGVLVATHYRDREWAEPSIRICFALLVCWFSSASSMAADAPSDELAFAKNVQPILEAKCVKWHSGPAPKGGLDLRRKDSLLRGGDSGPALTQGAAESSLLWQMIVTGKMPAEGEKLTATERAVLRTWINAGAKGEAGYYYQTIDDTLKIVASSTLGLTLQCAKCHSHKYDPIPQTDYYRLQAVFMSAYRPGQWVPQVQRRLLEATEAEEQTAKVHNDKLDAEIAG